MHGSGANSRTFYGLVYNNAEKARIFDILFLKNETASFGFLVDGSTAKASAGSWMANSNARLKENIESMNNKKMLLKLLRMKGVTHKWNDNVTDFVRS